MVDVQTHFVSDRREAAGAWNAASDDLAWVTAALEEYRARGNPGR